MSDATDQGWLHDATPAEVMMCASEEGPNPRAIIDNLRAPMPLGKKLRMIARNYWIRLSKRQGCCGHPGEPGC